MSLVKHRAIQLPIAALLAAALTTAGAAIPEQPPEEVLTAVDDATATSIAEPTLGDARAVVPLGESEIVTVGPSATLDIATAHGDIGVDLPIHDFGGPLVDDDGEVAVWSEDAHAVAVEELEDDVIRAMFVLLGEDAPRQYPIDVELPDDAEMQQREDGSVAVVIPGGGDPTDPDSNDLVIAYVDTPWAVDAAGAAVPTFFTIDGTTLVQHVQPTAATVYPVTADPAWFIPIGIAIARTALHVAVKKGAQNAAASVVRITPGMARPTSGGFANMKAFKAAHGTRPNYDWHHIVEANRIGQKVGGTVATARQINHVRNLVNIPRVIHQKCINSQMAKKFDHVRKFAGVTIPKNTVMRDVVQIKGWALQHEMGVALLRFCGISI